MLKVNFPPFQHYRLDAETMTTPFSWQVTLERRIKDWYVSLQLDGALTDKLARMYIMLCEKYAMKYNWRGYTYNDEMRTHCYTYS